MKKLTKLSIQWFYNLLERGECDIMDFKEQLGNKTVFGKSLKNFSKSYEELARDVVAFANYKGGFLFVGIVDDTKEINRQFKYVDDEIFKLIRQIQDRTEPTITILPHKLNVDGSDVLVLEIPFSHQLHRTSKGEFLIRSNDGNRPIEPYEIATIQSEKNLIVYDQKTWNVVAESTEQDHYGNPIPGWQSQERIDRLVNLMKAQADKNGKVNAYLQKSQQEMIENLGMAKDDGDGLKPTTTGLLFIGNDQALKELPYSEISYNRYYDDGSYETHIYRGNIIEIAQECFAQLKSEIRRKEFRFGLFREYVDDYSETVIRESLMNALAHRDYSRQQIIEIRKYPTYFEIESPGLFPEGIDSKNFLRKTNARNPNIMDILREIGLAEKAGSGFDKIFTDLLSNGKHPIPPEETDSSVIFRVEADVVSEKVAELSLLYRQETGSDMKMDYLLVLTQIVQKGKVSFADLENAPYISKYQLHHILDVLEKLEFIEQTGKTSGVKYILHGKHRKSTADKIAYSLQKKQSKARQREAILRYVDEVGSINNAEARQLLKLRDSQSSYVSKLLTTLVDDDKLVKSDKGGNKIRYYGKKVTLPFHNENGKEEEERTN